MAPNMAIHRAWLIHASRRINARVWLGPMNTGNRQPVPQAPGSPAGSTEAAERPSQTHKVMRGRPAWRQWLPLSAWLLIGLLGKANADELWPLCQSVSNTLAPDFVAQIPNNVMAQGICQPLNRHQLLYADDQDLQMCQRDASGEVQCAQAIDDARTHPGLRVMRHISGAKGKRHVLMQTMVMRGGVMGYGYHVFNLVSKQRDPDGFILYDLAGADTVYEACQSSANGPPGWVDRDVEAGAPDVQVLGEGTDNLTLAFTRRTRYCAQRKWTTTKIRYVLKQGKFVLAPHSSEPK